MQNLESISKSLEQIEFSNFTQYVTDLLTAFSISDSTIKRLTKNTAKNNTDKPIQVYRRAAIFNNGTNFNRHSLPNIEAKLSTINRLIILINEEKVICKDSVTEEIIEFEPNEIHNHVRFFVPLIYGSTNEKELTSTLGFAELIGSLYNLLCMDEENNSSKNQDRIQSLS